MKSHLISISVNNKTFENKQLCRYCRVNTGITYIREPFEYYVGQHGSFRVKRLRNHCFEMIVLWKFFIIICVFIFNVDTLICHCPKLKKANSLNTDSGPHRAHGTVSSDLQYVEGMLGIVHYSIYKLMYIYCSIQYCPAVWNRDATCL